MFHSNKEAHSEVLQLFLQGGGRGMVLGGDFAKRVAFVHARVSEAGNPVVLAAAKAVESRQQG